MKLATVDQSAGGFKTGSVILTGAAQQLVSDGSLKGCSRIRLIAPVNAAGAGANTEVVYFGDANNQHDYVETTGKEYVHIDDGAKLYVKGKAGETIKYRAEF